RADIPRQILTLVKSRDIGRKRAARVEGRLRLANVARHIRLGIVRHPGVFLRQRFILAITNHFRHLTIWPHRFVLADRLRWILFAILRHWVLLSEVPYWLVLAIARFNLAIHTWLTPAVHLWGLRVITIGLRRLSVVAIRLRRLSVVAVRLRRLGVI